MTHSIQISAAAGSHVQGIAVDAKREYIYVSITTQLVKADMNGNIVGSVTGLAGHLGCIAYNYDDGKVYGSLEFKQDSIGKGILANLGSDKKLQDGFYMTVFDVDKIDRIGMDAEKDGVMTAVFLKEVYDDYSAPGHRYGCSGIDGTTFAPAFGQTGGKNYLYVSYGVYSDTGRSDNDHQVILQYDVSDWGNYARPLNQEDMHRCGPASPKGKYFVFTGNTTYGIQNLEYDASLGAMIAAVYPGKKPEYPNYTLFFIDSDTLTLTDFAGHSDHRFCGSHFPYGTEGLCSLGGGYFYIGRDVKTGSEHSALVELYRFDAEELTFHRADI